MSLNNSLVYAMRYCGVCLFLLLSNISGVTAQVDPTNQEAPVQIRLKPDKATIMLGEPMFIAFQVTNMSGEKLCLGVGGDYRNRFGRPERFQVSVRAEDGAEVPQPEAITLGGFIGCDPIEVGETYTVRLFLPHWAAIERTGLYRINVKRQMGFSAYESSDSGKPKYSMLADVNAEFIVGPPDENTMGAIITSLGTIMLSSDPRATESATALASIQDKRVITFFAEALRKFGDLDSAFEHLREVNITSQSVAALGTYDDDRAIEALESAMRSSSDDTRLKVATALVRALINPPSSCC